jgi:serpin B
MSPRYEGIRRRHRVGGFGQSGLAGVGYKIVPQVLLEKADGPPPALIETENKRREEIMSRAREIFGRALPPFFLAALVSAGCSNNATSPSAPPRALTKGETQLVEADNTFGFELLKRLNAGMADSNVFISPVSVSMALGMTLDGARGDTRSAMVGTLGFGAMSQSEINESYRSLIDLLRGLDPKVKFAIANSIWYRAGEQVRGEFIADNRSYFDAEVSPLDFAAPSAASTINGWVKRSTNGRIEKIVPDPIPSDIVMYLINAIYFKGAWSTEFDPKNTRDDSFTLANGGSAPCSMMNRTGEIRYMENERFQAVDLPYGDAGYSMTVLLPKRGIGADALVADLTGGQWADWVSRFQETELILSMPKFKVEYGRQLNDALKAMGMAVAFDAGGADLSGIGGEPGDLYISEVEHRSFIEVNEEGTEASAATSVGVGRTSAGPGMRVDRPFLFAIRENHTGAILFIGKIARPTL